jgi:hypothetical protein
VQFDEASPKWISVHASLAQPANTRACAKSANRRFEKPYISSISNICLTLRTLDSLNKDSIRRVYLPKYLSGMSFGNKYQPPHNDKVIE